MDTVAADAPPNPFDLVGPVGDDEISPVEQVRLTVTNTDDPSLPVWTFRMWFLGVVSCAAMSFLNQFFAYRTEPLVITQISVQVASLPVGHFMARVLPRGRFRLPGFGEQEFSLNPGAFTMKEHVLISIFANAGCAFGSGSAYAVGIVTIVKALYRRSISFHTGWILIITTQVLGYGCAGLLRKYVVEPAHMWWPSSLAQVSLIRALHEKDEQGMSRAKFFWIILICSFCWYAVPGHFFPTLTTVSWVCWAFSKSVTAQQLGSGMRGLGLGAFTLDWYVVAAFMFSPLIYPFFAIANVYIGFILIVYVAMPVCYWGLDLYNAKTFPLFSSHLFTATGHQYNITAIVNDKFEIDMAAYSAQGKLHLSIFFALSYGIGFAAIASALTHVALFNGRVLKQGGRFLCLELSHVELPVFKQLYDYYSFSIIPAVGELVAGDRGSYQYLVESIRRFPSQKWALDLASYQAMWQEFQTTPTIFQDVLQQLMELF